MEYGFIHDMLDVKLLVLYIMARVNYPVDLQKIYELAYQDDTLSYFDLAQAVPDMVESGHLEETEGKRYLITEKGREACAVTEDAVAFPVMQRAQAAIDRFNREMRRSSFVKTELIRRDAGDFTVRMTFNDEVSELLKLELMAPTQKQAHRLATAFSEKAEVIYKVIMDQLLAKPKDKT
ncbi:MAG: DUF4364 family protein [Candidatus Faecousia sp.]|jgi:hypothetical protein|uniref:DUF4364 family protein n=1 Tax=Faecousia sp. TaxID=2952921 RepID=UPI002A889535|nr:DUF4364 family protein [Candidatus Faecousia sp.]